MEQSSHAAAAPEPAPRAAGGVPWTLWRHVAWELFRTFFVTVSIIVTVIAFGAAAKPLAEDAIGAETVLKYVGLAMVPMMQYAMPFAAGLAATLTLHRFATDNEVLAMSAGGMSPAKVFAPVLLVGTPLLGVMLALVLWMIPAFYTRMQELATADATQMLVASVARGEALRADRLMIYADTAREVAPPPGVRRRLELTGVAAIELAPSGAGAVDTEFTAEGAFVDVHSTPRGAVAKVALTNASVYRPREGTLITVPRAEPEAAAIYGSFDRGPKFLSIGEIAALRRDPDRATPVRGAKHALAARLAERDLWACVDPMLARGRVELAEAGSGREVVIEGAAREGARLRPAAAGGTFRLLERVDGRAVRSAVVGEATLRAVCEPGFPPRMALSVPAAVSARDEVSGLPGRWSPQIDDLVPAGCRVPDWAAASSAELLREADGAAGGGAFASPAAALRAAVSRVSNDADSYVSNRLAQAVSVVLVLLLGAVLAVAMRHALPLTVYVLAFVPAIASIIMIASGRQMMASGSYWGGFAILWGGDLVLAAALWGAWRRVARN
jgi:hypothetical protein